MKRFFLLIPLLITALLYSCKPDFPVITDFGNNHYKLVDQDNKEVVFPDFIKNKVTVIGYIYTNCPSICPLTTNNMNKIQQDVKKDGIKNVDFVSLSFDPDADTPEVLKKYADVRNLDLSNWEFLTGKKSVIDSLVDKSDIFVVKSDSTVFPDGHVTYYYVHTDRIALIDQQGRIRKNYSGSKIDIDEIMKDIKKLAD